MHFPKIFFTWFYNKFSGGGLGGTRRGGPDVNIKHSGREDNERERERYRLEREKEERDRRDRDSKIFVEFLHGDFFSKGIFLCPQDLTDDAADHAKGYRVRGSDRVTGVDRASVGSVVAETGVTTRIWNGIGCAIVIVVIVTKSARGRDHVIAIGQIGRGISVTRIAIGSAKNGSLNSAKEKLRSRKSLSMVSILGEFFCAFLEGI